MFFKDFVSVKGEKIKKGASQTYDTPSSSQRLDVEVDVFEPVSNIEARTVLSDIRQVAVP